MNDLINTIEKLKVYFSPLTISKDEFLALCVKDRLEINAQKYNKQFKSFLDVLERDYVSETKINNLTKSLKVYSQTSAILYKGLLKQLKNYNNNSLL